MVAEGLAEAQVRFPSVPIVFCETRRVAQEWTYRYLGAAVAHHLDHDGATELQGRLPTAGPVAPAEPTTGWLQSVGVRTRRRSVTTDSARITG